MWPKAQHLKILLETYSQPAKKKIKLEVADSKVIQKLEAEDIENLQENDFQPESKKIKLEVSDSKEIQNLKETINKLKRKKFFLKPKKNKKKLKKLNLKLLDVMKELVTLI